MISIIKKINIGAKSLTPMRMIVLSFLGIISLGMIMLLLPWTKHEGSLSFIDALFTSVSAVCVTGLSVVNIGTEFTAYGQIVVLLLIQIGGLGIMTFSTFFLYLLNKRVSIRNREIIDSTLINEPELNISTLLFKIIIIVFSIEGIGVILFTLSWLRFYPFHKALYYSIFHSISAFCNAGFSLYQNSFEGFQSDIYMNIILMILIVLGGLGFVVLLDLKKLFKKPGHIRNVLSFHTKVVLSVTAFLIISGMAGFYLVEGKTFLKEIDQSAFILTSLFQSVTARTAGFNTVSISLLSNQSCFILMFLMFVGGASGSCAGGVKVTTFGILIALFFSKIKRYDDPHLFKRSISRETVGKVLAIVLSSVLLIGIVFFCLLLSETWPGSLQQNRGVFIKLLFEAISAFGTVGLSMGVTTQLSWIGRLMLIILMFVGRLGPLTMAVALARRSNRIKFRYAKGEIMVG